MVNVKKVVKIYESGTTAITVLKEVSFDVNRGEYVLLTGKSGSGKSTLLNILTGIDRPSSGEVFINNKKITGLNEDEMALWRGRNVGIIFQFFQLIPTLSVLENIILPMDLTNTSDKNTRHEKAMSLLKTVGFENHAHKMPSGLSGGEQQRVAIARSLANDADIVVADEPTGNLDSQNAEIIFELLRNLNKQGKTIIMVTHERDAIKGAKRKISMKDGVIIEDVLLKEEA